VMDADLAVGVRLVLGSVAAATANQSPSTESGNGAVGGIVVASPAQSIGQSQVQNETGLASGAAPIILASNNGLGSQAPALGAQTLVFDEQRGHFVPSKLTNKGQTTNNFVTYINLDQNSVRQSLYQLHEDAPSFTDSLTDSNETAGVKSAKPAVRVNWAGYNG